MAEISKVRFGGVDYDLKSITDASLSEAGMPADAAAVTTAINGVKNSLSDANLLTLLDITWKNGYISKNGTIAGTTGNGRYSEPFYCKSGQTIKLYGQGYLTNICMIAKVAEEDVSYVPLVVSTDSELRNYTYVVDEDGYYAVSIAIYSNSARVIVSYDIVEIYGETADKISKRDSSSYAVSNEFTVTQNTSQTYRFDMEFKKGDKISLKLIAPTYINQSVAWYYKNTMGTQILIATAPAMQVYEYTLPEDATEINIYIGKAAVPQTTTYKVVVRKLATSGIIPNELHISPSDGLWGTIKSIKDDCDRTNPYYIYLASGQYDVASEFTSEEINSAAYNLNGFVGVCLYDGMYLVGETGGVTVLCDISTDYTQNIRNQISTINTKGNCGAENITFRSNNIRYTVHDDYVQSQNSEHVFKNCKFIHTNGTGSYAYGNGMNSGAVVSLIDCEFIPSLLSHLTASATGWSAGSKLLCSNCKTKYAVIRDNDTKIQCLAKFDNCDIQELELTHEGKEYGQYLAVEGVNTVTIFNAPAGTVYCLGGCFKVPVSNLTIGTCVDYSNSPTSVANSVVGVVVAVDSDFAYIQASGFIASQIVGITGAAVGDYWTVSGNLIVDSGSASNAIAKVIAIKDGKAFAKLLF